MPDYYVGVDAGQLAPSEYWQPDVQDTHLQLMGSPL